jgi:hypothetical protein
VTATPKLRFSILPEDVRNVLETQASSASDHNFFLAGGSALALRLGHRSSRDLDWFTASSFKLHTIEEALEVLPVRPDHIAKQSAQTLRASYGEVETSFILYRQVPPQVEMVTAPPEKSFPLAKIEMLAAMKAAALHDRGTKRDFIDVYAICRQPGWSVTRFVDHAARILPLLPEQVAKALTYFKDAEPDPMPAKCTISWAAVKEELTSAVRKWERERSRER